MNVSEIFEQIEFGPAPESPREAIGWLDGHSRKFGHFIGGEFVTPRNEDYFQTINPATGDVLAEVALGGQHEIEQAVVAARIAFAKWRTTPGVTRARYLYAIARAIQKHSRLFSVLETLDNGKPIRESRDLDIPLVARHFYYHAGAATLMQSELPDQEAIGVCGQIVPWNFPLLMLAWKIAPALAMGNVVVLKPAEYTSLTALLFAEITAEIGLPPGVVNIVTGDGSTGELLVKNPDVDKIAFTGSTGVGKRIRRLTAGKGKSLTLELGGKSPYIVFDDADLDSAVEGLVDAIWFNQGQVCCAGSRLLVQESVMSVFHRKLTERMDKLRIGDPMDKSADMGAIVHPVQLRKIDAMVQSANTDGGTVYHAGVKIPETGCYYPPTLISGLSPSSPLMQDEIFGPVLVSATFRTPEEAIALANNSRYGLAATVWSENINLALHVAPKLKSGVVWVNSTNLFDAASGFGGYRESGFGREGGWEGLWAYTKTRPTHREPEAITVNRQRNEVKTSGIRSLIDRTAKLYIGGKQVRPDGGYSIPVRDGGGAILEYVGRGNRKDVRNAVEAAHAAHAWATFSGHLRAQILYYLAENLSARSDEFSNRLMLQTGFSDEDTTREVSASIDRLFTYAAWADKFDGDIHQVPIQSISLAMREPLGVVGAICPGDFPLLGFVSLFAPLVAMGNRCILIPSEDSPLSATDLYQVLETSDVPPGVINIVTGLHSELTGPLSEHDNVDGVWCFGDKQLFQLVERGSVGNLKRTWVDCAGPRNWFDEAVGAGRLFLRQACEIKNIWIPYGE